MGLAERVTQLEGEVERLRGLVLAMYELLSLVSELERIVDKVRQVKEDV